MFEATDTGHRYPATLPLTGVENWESDTHVVVGVNSKPHRHKWWDHAANNEPRRSFLVEHATELHKHYQQRVVKSIGLQKQG